MYEKIRYEASKNQNSQLIRQKIGSNFPVRPYPNNHFYLKLEMLPISLITTMKNTPDYNIESVSRYPD